MKTLEQKWVVITGASGGIGREIALQAASHGANVVLLARSIEKLKQVELLIKESYNVEALSFQLDVANPSEVELVFTAIYKQVDQIDILVNNAGFGLFKEVHEATLVEVKEMFDVNVLGLIACTSMVVSQMRRRKSGHIINIASQAGKIATPKSSGYSATKYAVLGFTNSLRLECMDDNVYVTTVNPGPIATDFFTMADQSGTYVKSVEKYMLKPEYVAKKVVESMMKNKREINLPGWMNAASIFYTLFPKTVERIGKNAFFKK
ncbi:SDR family NAD(P)-dependent oxidoreductase [Peribacillus alkalitolerans]|uniref:SDR family NAD(P)-dependent oxidoreductase n=1 Tax=Peribacillus alkalitolerans TaxID=1550385 RepID=UPI0013D5FC28|nr:SDR family oxidoreductase [Peribacillus alkalitolerans]